MNLTRRHSATRIAAVVAALGALTATSCSAPVLAAPATQFTLPTMTWDDLTARDELFLGALDHEGIEYLSPHTAVSTALAVCLLRSDGAEFGAYRAAAGVAGWLPSRAGYFTGAATAAYCPDLRP
ncbi:DUF732 domain-containing protein [Rhodococcus sp. NPDC003348]